MPDVAAARAGATRIIERNEANNRETRMAKQVKPAARPLDPITIPQGNIRYAPGVRAGRWIFTTGHKAVVNHAHGIADQVLSPGAPNHNGPKLRREAEQIFKNTAR